MRCRLLLLIMLSLPAANVAAHAQGGPPFRTDDPETPGNKHFEINFGFIGDRGAANGGYQVPDFDLNYGLGDRIQLKYELPIAIEEQRALPAGGDDPAQPASLNLGMGNSLLGVKWRFFEHHAGDPWLRPNPPSKNAARAAGKAGGAAQEAAASLPEGPVVDFSVSTYPQLTLGNPTSSIVRGVVPRGPDLLLPLEVNARLGPVRLDAEVGYHFGNADVAQSWIRGLLVGHEFGERTEAYLELYDQQDANRLPEGRGHGAFETGGPKQRETTLGLGGRQALNRRKTLLLLLMAGRSFQTVAPTNSQPGWIAYTGLQVLLGPREPVESQVEQTKPDLAR